MKNTTIAGALALMGVVLFSCAKEISVKSLEENTDVSGKAVTITATATVAETKTTYVDNTGIEVNWEASESFKAYTTGYGTGSELTFTKTDAATTQSATFQTTGAVSDGATLYAVYDPQGKFTSGTTIDLTNAYVTNVNNLKNYDVMFAEGTVSGSTVNFAFTHKLSFFKVTLNRGSLTAAGNDNDLKLTLVFNNCQKVGDYNYTGCEFSGNVLTRTITLATGDVPAANASRTIYVAMPPLEYVAAGSPVSSGLTASYSKIFSLKDGKSIAAGKVYSTTVPFAPDHTTANFEFGNYGGNGKYLSDTYTWWETTNNLMELFSFSAGTLSSYNTLNYTLSDFVGGMVRIGCVNSSSTFTEFGSGNGSSGPKTFTLSGVSSDVLNAATKISFGGRGTGTGGAKRGHCGISNVSLSGNGVSTLTATFVAPASNASASYGNTYIWTSGSDNLMTCYSFSNSELAYYSTLKLDSISKLSGGSFRINFLFSDNKNKSATFYNTNDLPKTINLKTYDLTVDEVSHTLADVTAIRFGGNSMSDSSTQESILINPSYMWLEK